MQQKTVLIVAGVLLGSVTLAFGQEAARGTLLTFGLELGFDAAENRDMDVDSEGTTTEGRVGLTFDLDRATQTEALRFSGGVNLRAIAGPDYDGTEFEVADPRLKFRWAQERADTTLSFDARYSESDVSALRSLDDFLDDDGVIVLPPDFDDLTGTGIRREYGANAGLTWGKQAPFGGTVTLGYTALDYNGTSSPDLVDNTRASLGTTFRANLNPVTSATLGLRYSRFEEDGEDLRETFGTSLGLTRDLPDGSVNATLTADDTEDGVRTGLSLGRVQDLPAGRLSYSLGVTQPAEGDPALTGAFGWAQELPRGNIDAQLRRSITDGEDDTDQLVTGLLVSYNHAINPLSQLGLSLSYVDTEDTASGDHTINAALGLSYTRALTPDWGLNLGYRHRLRDEDSEGTARSDAIFLTLRRSFTGRP